MLNELSLAGDALSDDALSVRARPFIEPNDIRPLIFLENFLGNSYVKEYCPLARSMPFTWATIWPKMITGHIVRLIQEGLAPVKDGHVLSTYLCVRFGLDGSEHRNWAYLNEDNAPEIIGDFYRQLQTEYGCKYKIPHQRNHCLRRCKFQETNAKLHFNRYSVTDRLRQLTKFFSVEFYSQWQGVKIQTEPMIQELQLCINSNLSELLDWHRARDFISAEDEIFLQRTMNALERVGILTIQDLIGIAHDHKPCKGFGEKTRHLLSKMLRPFSLSLGMDPGAIMALAKRNRSRVSKKK